MMVSSDNLFHGVNASIIEITEHKIRTDVTKQTQF